MENNMKLKNTLIQNLQQNKNLSKSGSTGVSLHCHTQFSKEMLDFIPHYAQSLPVISYFFNRENAKIIAKTGKPINLDEGYWSPPMTEDQVFLLEKEQINSLGLEAIVSITDHDEISANLNICEHTSNEVAPISFEWTVPYQYGFFHVGVHNLPKENALDITKTLLDFTFDKKNQTNECLFDLFSMLNELPNVLLVLNHPIWDIEIVGQKQHDLLLKNFLAEHGKSIHALEVNGFRSWSENKAVINLAESLGIPLVSGGDRHGCQPNTVLNLTNSNTFAGFVEEVRVDKHTEIILMPEHNEPLHSRQLQSFSEILKYYEDFPEGRKRWFDRVFVDADGNGVRQLSDFWKRGGPKWLRAAIWILGVMGSPKLRPVFRLAMKQKDLVPKEFDSQAVINFETGITENEKLIRETSS
jgi:hypothetical protein